MPQLQISHEPISLALVGPGCRDAVVFQGNPELYTSYDTYGVAHSQSVPIAYR